MMRWFLRTFMGSDVFYAYWIGVFFGALGVLCAWAIIG